MSVDLDIAVRRRVEDLAHEIQSCTYCKENQEFDIGFVIGDALPVRELLAQAGVAEGALERYLPLICCPNCGTNGTDLDLDDEVGMPTGEELLHRERWNEWTNVLRPRVSAFAAHLEAYPYLGVAHHVGKEILDTLPEFPRITLPPARWWRARKADGARVLTVTDLQPPPNRDATTEGRFNHYGQAVFYLGGTQRAALREIIDLQSVERVAWLQEFSFGAVENVLDLRVKDWTEELAPPLIAVGLTSEYISATPSSTAWKPEYLVPRFIADAARYAGYRGIIFNSAKHSNDNLVLFTWSDLGITPDGEPILRVVERDEEDDFHDNPPF